jgi:hypothetical protein
MYEIKGIDYYYIENTKNYTLQVYYKIKDDFYEGNDKTNVVLAAFVTSQARLKLYSELEKLGERVLYFDTDSIFYVSRPNEYEPKTGDQLGDLTNEIDSSIGTHIIEFISAGPKNYCFKTNLNITKTTIKGFTLNKIANEKINFDEMKRIVTCERTCKIQIPQQKFFTCKKSWNASTNIINKNYGFVYDKRILLDGLTTLPFGYKY